nr:beta-adaptin-like protein B isoform X2 [Ipomoea batatas]
MKALVLIRPSTGTILVGSLCWQNILSHHSLKDLWLFLLIVNGFGIVTGSTLFSTNLIVNNCMEQFLATIMWFLLLKELLKRKLNKSGNSCIQLNHMSWT